MSETERNAGGAIRRRRLPVAVLVVSCDRYADVWPAFFALFSKHWPDCPYPVFLGTNERTYDHASVRTLQVGPDMDWSSNVREMLRQLDAEHVILLLEDFFLTADVDDARVRRLVDMARTRSIGCLRLVTYPPPFAVPGEPVDDLPDVRRVVRGHPYRVTSQAAIWRSDVLDRYLFPGATAWDFELLGSVRSLDFDDEFWEVTTSVLGYEHGVEKGCWNPRGVRVLTAAGIPVDRSVRCTLSDADFQVLVEAAAAGVARSCRYHEALVHFRRGERSRGALVALRSLVADPRGVKMLAILAAGLIGPGATAWLERMNVERKIAACARRARRSGPPASPQQPLAQRPAATGQ